MEKKLEKFKKFFGIGQVRLVEPFWAPESKWWSVSWSSMDYTDNNGKIDEDKLDDVTHFVEGELTEMSFNEVILEEDDELIDIDRTVIGYTIMEDVYADSNENGIVFAILRCNNKDGSYEYCYHIAITNEYADVISAEARKLVEAKTS